MSFHDVFTDPAFEPYILVGQWIFVLGLLGNLFAELTIKFVRIIMRLRKRNRKEAAE